MSASINISSRRRQGRRVSVRTVRAPPFRKGFRRRPNQFIVVPRQMAIVPRALQGEKKFFDVSLADASATSWTTLSSSLCVPAQGQTVETRIGDKLSVLSINVRVFVSMNAVEAAVAPSPVILTRFILGVIPAGGGATPGNVVDTGATTLLLSYYQNSTISDFIILKDWMVRVDPHALNEGVVNSFGHGVSVSDVIKFTHVFKKPLAVRFAAGTTTVTRGTIFLMAVSTATGATQNIETRCRFTDA